MSIFIFLSTKHNIPEENAFYETKETVICILVGEFFTMIYKTKRDSSLLEFKIYKFDTHIWKHYLFLVGIEQYNSKYRVTQSEEVIYLCQISTSGLN